MKRIVSILICLIVFFLLIEIRTTWDSYRFYHEGVELMESDRIQSIHYFSSSIKADPLFSYYSEKSNDTLEKLQKRTQDSQIIMMIQDELEY